MCRTAAGRDWDGRVPVGREGGQEQQTCSTRAPLAARISLLTFCSTMLDAATDASNRHSCLPPHPAHRHRHASAMATRAAMDCRASVRTSASPGSCSGHAPRRQEHARAQPSRRRLGGSGKEIHIRHSHWVRVEDSGAAEQTRALRLRISERRKIQKNTLVTTSRDFINAVQHLRDTIDLAHSRQLRDACARNAASRHVHSPREAIPPTNHHYGSSHGKACAHSERRRPPRGPLTCYLIASRQAALPRTTPSQRPGYPVCSPP